MRVSVLMPIYNAAPYLGSAITSVRRQTYHDWELLLVDDGSTDESAAIATDAAGKDPRRIRFLSHPGGVNRGVSASRNLAASAARGEVLAFLDADDTWTPQKLERQLQGLTRAPGDTVLVYSRAVQVDEHDVALPAPLLGQGPRLAAWTYGDFLQADVVAPTMTVLLRADVLRALGGFPVGLSHQVEDLVVWARAMKRGRSLFVDTVAGNYRVHVRSATGRLSTLRKVEARVEGLCRIADDEGALDPDLALALARQARAALAIGDAPKRERAALARAICRELCTRGGFTPSLAVAALRRRAKTIRQAGAAKYAS